jgi:hypothetical protein
MTLLSCYELTRICLNSNYHKSAKLMVSVIRSIYVLVGNCQMQGYHVSLDVCCKASMTAVIAASLLESDCKRLFARSIF